MVWHPTAGETVTWMTIIIEAHRSLTQELLNKVPCTKLKIYKHRTLSYAIKEICVLLSVRLIVNAPNSISTSGALRVTVIPMVMSDTSPTVP